MNFKIYIHSKGDIFWPKQDLFQSQVSEKILFYYLVTCKIMTQQTIGHLIAQYISNRTGPGGLSEMFYHAQWHPCFTTK